MVNEDFLLKLEVSIVPANHKSDAILPFIDLDFKRHFSVAIPFKLQPQKSPVSAVEAGLFGWGAYEVTAANLRTIQHDRDHFPKLRDDPLSNRGRQDAH